MATRRISGFGGRYEISDDGAVKVVGPDASGRRRHIGTILKSFIRNGYKAVHLSFGVEVVQANIHTLVAQAFLGDRPDGKQVNHRDGNRLNNHVDNLEYVTPSENYRHALTVLGHQPPHGKAHWASKLSEADVIAVFALRDVGMSQRRIAERFGVRQPAIQKILSGKNRKHG